MLVLVLVLVIAVLAVMLVLAIAVVVRWLVVAGCFESLPKYSLPND